jgi:hypothetical protein
MLSSSRVQMLSFAAASALVVLSAASVPAHSEEPWVNLGPVGPYEPIRVAVGSKRVLAFFEPNVGQCAVRSVVWDVVDADADTVYSAVQLRISLKPSQIVHIDASENETVNLQCGDNAATLAVVDGEGRTASDTSIPKPTHAK